MARGWESKSVEAQIDSAEARSQPAAKEHLTQAEIERRRKKQSLLLSRKRVLEELKNSRHPRHQKILNDALKDLDEKLAALD
jgi:uncharacterized protein with WD repeat